MIILGLDPGTAKTGYGIVKKELDGSIVCINFGCIETPAGTNPAFRLNILRNEIKRILSDYLPQNAGVEQLFFTVNAKTAISVAHARGVILETLYSSDIGVYEFTPLQVKQSVTGYGKADKSQVQKMVKALLKLDRIPKPDDAADALAVAICCAYSINSNFNLNSKFV